MTLTLQALESAFTNIESVGKGELAFPVAGTPVVIRIIPPDEEALVHKQAGKAAQASEGEGEDEDGTQHRAMFYINEVKLGIVAHAIIEIDNLNLRDFPYIETGEKLANGKPVKIARAEAIRKIIKQREWSGTLQAMMFRKYGELLERVEREAEDAITFEPSDRKPEIERLKKRLAQLEEQEKAAQDKNDNVVGTEFAKQLRTIVAIEKQDALLKQENLNRMTDKNVQGSRVDSEVEEPEEEEEPEVEEAPSEQVLPPAATRRPIIPLRAAPPVTTASRMVPVQSPQAAPQPQQAAIQEDNSFIDMSDPESVQQVVEMENQRLMTARMSGGTQPSAPADSVLNMTRAMRRPPHLDAQEVDRNFLSGQSGVSQALNAPVVKAPVEELVRPQSNAGAPPMTVNTPVRGQVNPRFKPTGSR